MKVARHWIVGGMVSLALAGPAAAQSEAPPTQLWREGPGVAPEPELARLNTALTRLAEQLKPALVQIRVQRPPAEEPDPEDTPLRALGSGFVIHPSGYVVTNAHVVERSSSVQVRLASGRRFAGTVIGRDRRVDLALLKVDAAEALPVLSLGDSERLAVGELVLALGHPFGLDHTVSLGIVSRKGAPLQAAAPGFDFIQTDAAVNPGNSGGPLVDMSGRVVGVNFMATRNGSIGFAIPINLIKALLPQLLAKGTIDWGWLGVRIDEITDENVRDYGLDAPRGVGIEGVLPGQPAAQAGLRAKDVILQVNGQVIGSPRELQRVISITPVGTPVRLSLWRDGQPQELTVTVGRFPDEDASAPRRPR
jgi:serine protease Do